MTPTSEQERLIETLVDVLSWSGDGCYDETRMSEEEAQAALVAEFARLNADNARLREVIKLAQQRHGYGGAFCVCCDKRANGPHLIDCPAFTPEGEVK